MSTILVTGASGFVGRRSSRPAGGRSSRRRPGPHADAGEMVLGGLPTAQRDGRRDPDRRRDAAGDPRPGVAGVDAVVHLVAIPRDFNGGADLRLVNTEGTRAVVAAMREAGVRRLVHMGAMGVADDPSLHYASSKAKAEALVRDSGLDWTILKPSLQFGEGDGFFNIIAGLVRLSPGVVPVPGDGSSRFQPIHVGDVAAVVVRVDRRPDARSAGVRAGRPALLDLPRDHPRGPARRSASAGSSCRCRCRSSVSSPGRRSASTSRSRSPPTSCASSSSTTSGRSTSSRRGSASSRDDGGGARLSQGPGARPGRQARRDRPTRRRPA